MWIYSVILLSDSKFEPMKSLCTITFLVITIIILACACNKDEAVGLITDADGNVYHKVSVGNQVWMKENLKTTKFRNGNKVPLVPGFTAWMRLTTPGYCWYDNDPASNKETFGALYNWHAVNSGKLCPAGWHVPTAEEWITLIEYLGGENVAGGKLKEEGTLHWDNPNTGATNELGFDAVAGGARGIDGSFIMIGQRCSWWTSTVLNDWSAKSVNIDHYETRAKVISYGKTNGMSVRCIMD